MFLSIASLITSLRSDTIPDGRKFVLQSLIDFIQAKVDAGKQTRLNFICTHNSRRSHLSQIWAQVMAHHFSIPNVTCYSGGTESTALFPVVAQTLTAQGFQITMLSQGSNPVYAVKYDLNEHPVIGFSKKLDDDFNPSSHFAAIMTCSQADEGCPLVSGAQKRIPVTYEDPKAFDNTPEQAKKYTERSIQIATEMLYVFSCVDIPAAAL